MEKISENCLLQNCILDDTLKHLDLIWSNSKLDCLKYLLEICSEPKGHISNNVDLRFFFENIFKKEFIETISFKEVSNSEAP